MVEENNKQNVPIPDPTSRTIETMERAIENLNDKVDTAIISRTALDNEKFARVHDRFDMMEEHRKEQKADTKSEVEAAFAAQKEAAGKSEAATHEAIEQLRSVFSLAVDNQNRTAGDLKERVVTLETRNNGNPLQERVVAMGAEKAGAKENSASTIAYIALAGVIIAIVIDVVLALSGKVS